MWGCACGVCGWVDVQCMCAWTKEKDGGLAHPDRRCKDLNYLKALEICGLNQNMNCSTTYHSAFSLFSSSK